MFRTTQKHKRVISVKSKPTVLVHLKVNPVLKIDVTFHKQADSMWGGGAKGPKKCPLLHLLSDLCTPLLWTICQIDKLGSQGLPEGSQYNVVANRSRIYNRTYKNKQKNRDYHIIYIRYTNNPLTGFKMFLNKLRTFSQFPH